MKKKVAALGMFAALVAASSAACDYLGSEGPPPRARETDTPEPPTPTPLPEGAWGLAVTAVLSTGGLCAIPEPPEQVVIAGEGTEAQITAQRGVDVTGSFRDEALAMHGDATTIQRPTLDCEFATEETWTAKRVAPDVLEGEITTRQRVTAGRECDTTALPCETRRAIRLTYASNAPIAKVSALPTPEPTAEPSPEPSPSPSPTPKGKTKPKPKPTPKKKPK